MHKEIIVGSILLIIISSMGCTLTSPETNPTYSVIPGVIIDYDFELEISKIWVKSAISDFKYNLINITLNSKNQTVIREDTNTYCIDNSIKSDSYNLSVQVIYKEREFLYQVSIKIEFIEDIFTLTIFEPETEDEDILYEDDLPFKTVLEELD